MIVLHPSISNGEFGIVTKGRDYSNRVSRIGLRIVLKIERQSRYFQFPSSNITQKLFDHFLIMFILEHISYRVM